MSIVTVGAVFSLVVLGCYMLFLSGLRISLIFGYITAGLQMFSGLYARLSPGNRLEPGLQLQRQLKES